MASLKKAKSARVTPQSPKGMHDILPHDQFLWERVRRALRETAEFYNFLRIDTPIVERAALFERSVGETSDIVEKEMFYLDVKGLDKLVLRPEGTAPVARAYLEHGLSHLGLPLKLYYEGPMFRHEQPQAGRFRQFHQIGFEIIAGNSDPVYDAQAIIVSLRLLEALKLKNLTVKLNSIGCRNCRPPYRKELLAYYRDKKDGPCADCKRRLAQNPLRLLDCKREECQPMKKEAPLFVDHLCAACHNHFKTVLEYLEELKLPYLLDHTLVRGFDYYSRTVFEIAAEGSEGSLCGGGRYDYLTEQLGGKSAPAVGAAIGIERVMEAMRAQNVVQPPRQKPKVYLVYLGDLAKKKSLRLLEQLREGDIAVFESLGKESLKAQLRAADKMGAPLALIFGQREAFEESVIVRDLKTGAQETVPFAKMVETVKKRLK